MLYFPILSSIPQFFDRHRGFAMGFILSGNGVGGLILAPLLHFMLERVGIRWTLRVLGAWNLVVTVPVACVARRPPGVGIGTAGPRPRTNAAILRKGTFFLQVSCTRPFIATSNLNDDLAVYGGFLASRWERYSTLLSDDIFNFSVALPKLDGQFASRCE